MSYEPVPYYTQLQFFITDTGLCCHSSNLHFSISKKQIEDVFFPAQHLNFLDCETVLKELKNSPMLHWLQVKKKVQRNGILESLIIQRSGEKRKQTKINANILVH